MLLTLTFHFSSIIIAYCTVCQLFTSIEDHLIYTKTFLIIIIKLTHMYGFPQLNIDFRKIDVMFQFVHATCLIYQVIFCQDTHNNQCEWK